MNQRISSCQHENYETIPEMFGSQEVLDDNPSPNFPHNLGSNRRSSEQLMEARMSASYNRSSNALRSERLSESDSVFANSFEAPCPPLMGRSEAPCPPLMGRSPISQKKHLRATISHSDVSPRSSLINERPPCPVPKSHMPHSHSNPGIEVSSFLSRLRSVYRGSVAMPHKKLISYMH